MKLPSDPTETKSVHVKVYVEPSISDAIELYRKTHSLESTSSAVRALILYGFDHWWVRDSLGEPKGKPENYTGKPGLMIP